MLTVVNRKQAFAYGDFDLLQKAQEIIDDYKKGEFSEIHTSTTNIIYALRVLVSRGVLHYSDICIKFNGQIITLNEKGELSSYPEGFDNWLNEFCKEILFRRLGKIK